MIKFIAYLGKELRPEREGMRENPEKNSDSVRQGMPTVSLYVSPMKLYFPLKRRNRVLSFCEYFHARSDVYTGPGIF